MRIAIKQFYTFAKCVAQTSSLWITTVSNYHRNINSHQLLIFSLRALFFNQCLINDGYFSCWLNTILHAIHSLELLFQKVLDQNIYSIWVWNWAESIWGEWNKINIEIDNGFELEQMLASPLNQSLTSITIALKHWSIETK